MGPMVTRFRTAVYTNGLVPLVYNSTFRCLRIADGGRCGNWGVLDRFGFACAFPWVFEIKIDRRLTFDLDEGVGCQVGISRILQPLRLVNEF